MKNLITVTLAITLLVTAVSCNAVEAESGAGDGEISSAEDEEAHLLRETLFKLNCRITIKNKAIFISGKLPLRNVGTNETAS